MTENQTFKNEADNYKKTRMFFWDKFAKNSKKHGTFYHESLKKIYANNIPNGSKILDIGCASGDLLSSLNPSRGVGIDFSKEFIAIAKQKHPHLEFIISDAHNISLDKEEFDYVILSDLVNDVWDVQQILSEVRRYCSCDTRIIFNFYSHLWNIPFRIAQKLGFATPILPQNWLTPHDMDNLLEISGFERLRKWSELVLPINVGFVSTFINRYLSKIFPFSLFSITNFFVVRVAPSNLNSTDNKPTVSVIIPARNESGHIKDLIQRVPNFSSKQEIIFVEGNSTDDTYESIQHQILLNPEKNCKLIKQTGKGKGNAVRDGFEIAEGDILMILDADITVPPEDLTRFYDLIATRRAEFVNGVRLVYPMEDSAMRFLNLVGNKFFSLAFSWLLGQPIRDTLCGTKVLRKTHYQMIAKNRSYFGDFDPFGDFDLLFGAARLDLKIMEVPIRYRARKYGETNISRWKHGALLLRMVVFAANKIKFI